jgi:hypothetical protein
VEEALVRDRGRAVASTRTAISAAVAFERGLTADGQPEAVVEELVAAGALRRRPVTAGVQHRGPLHDWDTVLVRVHTVLVDQRGVDVGAAVELVLAAVHERPGGAQSDAALDSRTGTRAATAATAATVALAAAGAVAPLAPEV